MDVDTWVVVWMYGCRYVGGSCMDGCVGRWVVIGWMYGRVSVGGWWLGGCMDGCVGKWEVVVWMYGWMCR